MNVCEGSEGVGGRECRKSIHSSEKDGQRGRGSTGIGYKGPRERGSEDRMRRSEDVRTRRRDENAAPPDGIIPSLLLLSLIVTSLSPGVTSTEYQVRLFVRWTFLSEDAE